VSVFLRATVVDAPVAWSAGVAGEVSSGLATRTVWCRVPDDWLAGSRLTPRRRIQLLTAACPADDRVVMGWREEVLTARRAASRPWRRDAGACFVAVDDLLTAVTPADLEAELPTT